MPYTKVEIEPITADDLLEVAAGNLEAFPTFYAPMEPEDIRPPHDERVKRFAHRLRTVISSPHVLATKAVLPSGPDAGKLVGITIWHRPGAPIYNMKRAVVADTEEDRESWNSVDIDKWEGTWKGWDNVRAELMGDVPHWYLAPIWVIPAYQAQGIGGQLLQYVIDQCDAESPPTPIYLEADKRGQPMYKKRGFVAEGKSEYVEMVRWNAKGTTRPEK
ncbi:GNAT family N-acetyltransferase [Rhodotorula paludigena]|uniref:GNAT family N-acetyltransferase n=1 Tax=Rhodotorula paludigena TaxID=86838 RepID=UPI00317286A3